MGFLCSDATSHLHPFSERHNSPALCIKRTKIYRNLLKSELKRKGVNCAQLIEKLASIGISEKKLNVATKLYRV